LRYRQLRIRPPIEELFGRIACFTQALLTLVIVAGYKIEMIEHLIKPCTAFEGIRLLLSGPIVEVALAVKAASDRDSGQAILVFNDATGRVVDLDLRGTKSDVISRLSEPPPANSPRRRAQHLDPAVAAPADELMPAEPRAKGRPKLGVISREVTLLPRHWEWLAAQPGGASVALRKLVEEARRSGGAAQQRRAAQEAAYHFMSALAGNLPGFEEAARALFADDPVRFEQQTMSWPEDIRSYAKRLAFGGSTGLRSNT
jgi:hypothetical protein